MFGTVLAAIIVSACQRKLTYLNISLFNYLDRPIFDVMMGETNFMGGSAHGFYGANGMIAMQPMSF